MDAFEEDWDNPNYTEKCQWQVFNNSHKEEKSQFQRGTNDSNSLNWRIKYDTNNVKKSSFGWKSSTTPKHFGVNKDGMLMKVDVNKIGKLIGKKGVKIKELQEKTGVKIVIGEISEDSPYLKEIWLYGNENSKQKCKDLIQDLVSNSHIISTSPPVEKEPIVIDWDAVNAIADKARLERWANVPPIKKNFYDEDPEIANMSESDVEEFRRNHFNICVRHVMGGEDEEILNPVKTFSQAFRHYPEILREIEKQGFEVPSPIQCQAWPILLSGKDLIGIAQTGTGKTLAFLLPALIHIDGQGVPREQRNGPTVLIIAPTRELSLQIESEVNKYSYKGIKCVCVYGGGNRKDQIQAVKQGVEIIIATPGRLNDLVQNKYLSLRSVTYIVLDEADRLLDLGFEPQIRKVLLDIRPDRQSVMTSATWPFAVQKLAERYMHNPVQVYVGSLDLAVVHSVSQTVIIVNKREKFDYLLDFLRNLSEEDKVIVFVMRKADADQVSCDLSMNGILCQCIHGNREQMDREEALEEFRTGVVKILIATDVASRGLDISDITKVFNYDFPKNMEEYVHRAGRTGRAGRKGEVITLFTGTDKPLAAELIKILQEAEQPIPEDLFKMEKSQLREKEERSKGAFRGRNSRYKRE